MSRNVCEHFVPVELHCQKCNSKQRWYEIIGDKAHVYDAPYSAKSSSVSIVDLQDLTYYRSRFQLSKIWGENQYA